MFRLLGKKIIAFYAQKFCLTGPMVLVEDGLNKNKLLSNDGFPSTC